MRTVKKHRRLAIAAGAVTTTLAMGAASMVIAANLAGPDTIADRLTNPAFLAPTAMADAPAQALDPATICQPTAATDTLPAVSCELWAKAGTIDLPGHPGLTIWGYAISADAAPTLPGPTIVATAGDTVTVRVHNDLTDGGGLGFTARSQPTSPRAELAGGDVATYSFTVTSAGTSVYGASPDSPTGNRQLAMGLSGVLVVRPVVASCPLDTPCAYGSPLTGGSSSTLASYDSGNDVYDGEAIIATSELDLALATSSDPAAFDMTSYHPTAHLINGKAFPDTEVIDGYPGAKVLVRYANLGLADHSMGLVGAYQRTLGRDGIALPHMSDDVTVPLNVGQTADVLVSVPTDATAGYRYALSDQVRQPGAQSADPAMTFLTVWGPAAQPGKPIGEVSFAQGVNDQVSGTADLPFEYTVPTLNGPVDAVQWSLDDPGVSPNLLPDTSGSGTIPATTLAGLVNGSHILWVQWSNDTGSTWGSPAGIAFTVDRAGPAVSPVDLDPMYTNGSVDVAVSATADATVTGTADVTEGVWNIDACNRTGTALALPESGAAPTVPLTGTIPAGTVGLLSEGSHYVTVQAKDSLDVWTSDQTGTVDECGNATLVVDTHAPSVSGAVVSPNPVDGTTSYPTVDTFLPVVRIMAHVSDPTIVHADTTEEQGSGIAVVEGFLDDGLQPTPLTTEMFGTGFLFTAVDGNLDSPEEDVYVDLPLAALTTIAPGDHAVWIHAQDAAGNWGSVDTSAAILTTVNNAPTVNDLFLDGTTLNINASAYGTGVTVVAYRYAIGAVDSGEIPVTTPGQVVNQQALSVVSGAEENIAVQVKDSMDQWSAPQYAKPVVTNLSITNQRRRLSGIVVPPPGGTVDSIAWSTGAAPAAPGGGTIVTGINGTSFTLNRNSTFGAAGTVVWVRAHDIGGVWGPAVSVTVP